MFTGIIEEIGTVVAMTRGARSFSLEVKAQKVLEGTRIGDSISTNGVCLTVTELTENSFKADVMPETVSRTALQELTAGSLVNLERALSLQTRLGGHLVTGHIDGTGRISQMRNDDNALWIVIECAPSLLRHIVEKGSITIQGVSLTVARVDESSFAVSLIPHTQLVTTLHNLRIGSLVNLETDIIAKYVEKMLGKNSSDGIMNTLAKAGFF